VSTPVRPALAHRRPCSSTGEIADVKQMLAPEIRKLWS
jgi:hypothetical protein